MIRKRFITNFHISVIMPERQCLIFNYKLVIWTSRPSKLTKEENIIIRSFFPAYVIKFKAIFCINFIFTKVEFIEKGKPAVSISICSQIRYSSPTLLFPAHLGQIYFFGILLEENQGGKLEEERYFLGPGWRRERESGRV